LRAGPFAAEVLLTIAKTLRRMYCEPHKTPSDKVKESRGEGLI
jgi:hypothetical protein